ncbi:MAG: hypothetical protein SVX43_13405 [Cyanobacteriota bacterium]|nr:hypothetical protein [Cyanobacteriota bacterium]
MLLSGEANFFDKQQLHQWFKFGVVFAIASVSPVDLLTQNTTEV